MAKKKKQPTKNLVKHPAKPKSLADLRYLFNLSDYVVCDYDREYQEKDDPYNKNSTIKNIRVTSTSPINAAKYITHILSSENIINNISLMSYCIQRLLIIYEFWNTSQFQAYAQSGYYGEEIGAVVFHNEDQFISALKKLVVHNNPVEYVLQEEYGYILERIKNKNWSVVKAKAKDLTPGNPEYMRKVIRGLYSKEQADNQIIGIYEKRGNSYILIDGYHRYCSWVLGADPNKEFSILTFDSP